MKMDWLFFTNLDHEGRYLPNFPTEFPISQGNVAFQEAFNCLNRFAGTFFIWLSTASNPNIFRRLSAITCSSSSRVYKSHVKQVTSCIQNLAGLHFGSRVKEEHCIQMLLMRLANSTLGQLWNDIEPHHAWNMLSLAAAVIPPVDNISPKVLAEAITLGNKDGSINGPVDRPYMEEQIRGCACVPVPSITFTEDATEPKTGIRFPSLLEDNSNLSTEVLVGMGFRSMRIMRLKSLKLYAFGLYIQPDSICEKLGPKYASVPIAELKNHPNFYHDLLRENIHMTVRLVVNCSGLSINTVRDAFEKSLCVRLQKMNPDTDFHCLKAFGSYFSQDIRIPMGTTIDFRQTADGQLITEIDGKHIGTVQSKDLCRAFFDMYIGDPPISLETKQDIAQNVAGLMRRC